MALLPTAVRRAVAHRTRPTRPRLAAYILLGRDGRQILRRPPLVVMQPCLLPERPPRINSWTYPVTQQWAAWDHPPQDGPEGPNPHLLRSTASRSSTYIKLLSTFVTH